MKIIVFSLDNEDDLLHRLRKRFPAIGFQKYEKSMELEEEGPDLLVLDSVITSDANSRSTKLLDLVLLALVNGRERTPDEWRQLLGRGGWLVTSIENGLIEAQAAIR